MKSKTVSLFMLALFFCMASYISATDDWNSNDSSSSGNWAERMWDTYCDQKWLEQQASHTVIVQQAIRARSARVEAAYLLEAKREAEAEQYIAQLRAQANEAQKKISQRCNHSTIPHTSLTLARKERAVQRQQKAMKQANERGRGRSEHRGQLSPRSKRSKSRTRKTQHAGMNEQAESASHIAAAYSLPTASITPACSKIWVTKSDLARTLGMRAEKADAGTRRARRGSAISTHPPRPTFADAECVPARPQNAQISITRDGILEGHEAVPMVPGQLTASGQLHRREEQEKRERAMRKLQYLAETSDSSDSISPDEYGWP